jgi:DNA-directed RNA polymerase subunit RPC12/RpoP
MSRQNLMCDECLHQVIMKNKVKIMVLMWQVSMRGRHESLGFMHQDKTEFVENVCDKS